jgi:hypothetical protein
MSTSKSRRWLAAAIAAVAAAVAARAAWAQKKLADSEGGK